MMLVGDKGNWYGAYCAAKEKCEELKQQRDELQREFDKLAAAAEKRIANLEQMVEWERDWKAELLEALIGLVAWADDLRRDDPAEDLRKARAAIEKVGAGRTAELDAKRYRWLRERLMAADFDWQDSGECALVFAWPKDCAVSGNCDATIDGAMLKTHNAGVTGAEPQAERPR